MFALFAGEHHYPMGGWKDLQGVYDTHELATHALTQHQREYGSDFGWDWAHIVDLSVPKVTWAMK